MAEKKTEEPSEKEQPFELEPSTVDEMTHA